MIEITRVSGNIFTDEKFSLIDKNSTEHILISRGELEKIRLRRNTNRGTDIGIILESGMRLNHGDVLESEGKTILIEQLPEKVITVEFKDAKREDIMILVGHIIGNRHRPIAIHHNTVSFPIQSESELQVFEKLFSEILDKIELNICEIIFKPHTGADVHEH